MRSIKSSGIYVHIANVYSHATIDPIPLNGTTAAKLRSIICELTNLHKHWETLLLFVLKEVALLKFHPNFHWLVKFVLDELWLLRTRIGMKWNFFTLPLCAITRRMVVGENWGFIFVFMAISSGGLSGALSSARFLSTYLIRMSNFFFKWLCRFLSCV